MHSFSIFAICSAFLVALFVTPSLCRPTNSMTCYTIYGKNGCWYFENAKGTALSRQSSTFKVDVSGLSSDAWYKKLDALNKQYRTNHRTSPYILKGCDGNSLKFIGGRDKFVEDLNRSQHEKGDAHVDI